MADMRMNSLTFQFHLNQSLALSNTGIPLKYINFKCLEPFSHVGNGLFLITSQLLFPEQFYNSFRWCPYASTRLCKWHMYSLIDWRLCSPFILGWPLPIEEDTRLLSAWQRLAAHKSRKSLVAEPELTSARRATDNLLLTSLELLNIPGSEDYLVLKEFCIEGYNPDKEVCGKGDCQRMIVSSLDIKMEQPRTISVILTIIKGER